MRTAYKNIQKGKNTNSNLSQGRIERLEEIGFQWKGVDHDDAFEKRCSDLTAFNEEHGHCNVPTKCANNPSTDMSVDLISPISSSKTITSLN